MTGDAQAQAEATPVEVSAETAADALGEVHEQLEQMPDSPEKELVEQTLQQLEAESPQEEESDKSGVEKLVEGVAEVLPDVAKATIETAQKVVEGVAESQQ